MIQLDHNERIDYLFDTDLKIIQSREVFSFSLDAVLLAKFVSVPIRSGNLIDLCTGNGAIPLLLSERTQATMVGVDIQSRLCDMASRSIRLNDLQTRISILCADIKALPAKFGNGVFDMVTCNPPYFTARQAHVKNPNPHLAVARHELCMTLADAIEVSGKLVRQKGKVAFVHRPERLMELFELMKRHRLAPKRLQFVHPRKGDAANMMLIEAIKDGNPGVKVLPSIHVYDDSGVYAKELLTFAHE
ncbi:tRNA1(Val) (adenine(37)-N6)-methyltransferase [Camelliibacillus cellulosilyticus]|uniref:tRNA1(Val) (Adenine(37)-N6)-methyltransferase n=1 Tax=Camelliibacillus cellulosilyticus TaxID=2174486 RepID=A0ABV9GQT5_9BACL